MSFFGKLLSVNLNISFFSHIVVRLYYVLSFINARFFGHFHIGQQGIGSALKSEKKFNIENPVTQISLKREKLCFGILTHQTVSSPIKCIK